MANELEIYRDWLGITETARPLNHYQLLRLKQFDDDAARVRERYRKMTAHVRKFAAGEHASEAQRLLAELAKAMLCLTDQTRKGDYDASLGRQGAGEQRSRTLEEILLAGKAVDATQLAKASSYAKAIGLETRDALVQQKVVTPEVMMMAYAESLGLPYVELDDVGVDETLAPQIPATLARQNSCVPIMADGGFLLMASPNPLAPDVEEELRLRLDMPVRTVLCTAVGVNKVMAKYYPRDAAAPAVVAKPMAGKKGAAKAAPVKKKAAAASTQFSGNKEAFTIFGIALNEVFVTCAVAFNMTVMVFGLFSVFTRRMAWNPRAAILAAGIALVLGLVVAGITYVVVSRKNR
jgi:hypothetical protein